MASQNILAFDCETTIDEAAVSAERRAEIAAREAAGERMNIRPYEWKIECVGFALVEIDAGAGQLCLTRLDEVGTPDWSEADRIAGFFEILERKAPRIVSWNGRGFDLPVVNARALVHGIPSGKKYERFAYRYSTAEHVDLMDFLSSFGAATRMDLDGFARACGFPGKPAGVDGSSVDKLMREGRRAEVVGYCLTDVLNLLGMFWRWRFVAGEISADAYDRFMAHLADKIACDMRPGFADFSKRWQPRKRSVDLKPWQLARERIASRDASRDVGHDGVGSTAVGTPDERAPRQLHADVHGHPVHGHLDGQQDASGAGGPTDPVSAATEKRQ
jgi:hypothetical protein